jgi:hypothetical protein
MNKEGKLQKRIRLFLAANTPTPMGYLEGYGLHQVTDLDKMLVEARKDLEGKTKKESEIKESYLTFSDERPYCFPISMEDHRELESRRWVRWSDVLKWLGEQE